MNSVYVEYKVLFLNLKRRAVVPESWEELNGEQLEALQGYVDGEVDELQFISCMSGLSRWIVGRLDGAQRFALLVLLDYTSNLKPMDEFWIKSICGLAAPKKRMQGVLFGQFVFIDSYYTRYVESGSEADLNRLIASLYTNGDFDEKKIDEYGALIGMEPMAKRKAICVNYRMVRDWLAGCYKWLFRSGESVKATQDNGGWISVFDQVVGDDIVNRDRYARLAMHEVLKWINDKIRKEAKK